MPPFENRSLRRGVIILLVTIISYCNCHVHSNWSHADQDQWMNQYILCKGKRQSPVAITEKNVKIDTTMGAIHFNGYNALLADVEMTNNGHTLKLQHDSSHPPSISSGPLLNNYELVEAHFHWGPTDNTGSEHQIGSKHYSAELHLVHKKLGLSLLQALNDPHGLAVLGVFYELNEDTDNPALDPIFDQMREVNHLGEVKLKKPLNWRHLFPADTSNFFFYNGSLTTPPCNEVVTWVVFTYPTFIGKSQLEKFRELDSFKPHSDEPAKKQTSNHRSVQPINDRIIKLRKPLVYNIPTSGAFNVFHDKTCLLALVMFLMIVKFVNLS